jgi:hypothetical protein
MRYVALLCAANAAAATPAATPDAAKEDFIRHFNEGDATAVFEQFDTGMRAAVPLDQVSRRPRRRSR